MLRSDQVRGGSVKLSLIAAISRNRVIGKDGKLPWYISEDLKRFKRLTTGYTVLMGRKTFESLGKPLPNRRNVVITTHSIAGVETYASLSEALDALKGEERVFIIGGGQIYTQLLEQADELYLTIVDRDVAGDTLFPPYEHLLKGRFTVAQREEHDGFTFIDCVKLT
jgi:dihydrofolate reductase